MKLEDHTEWLFIMFSPRPLPTHWSHGRNHSTLSCDGRQTNHKISSVESITEKLLRDLWEQQISYDCMAFPAEELLSRAYDNLHSCNARLAHQRSFFKLRLGVALILLFTVFLLFPYLGGA